MRLRRLDLVRYGKFTDRSIEFGSKPASRPDLHVVFGLNEAGKSTALSGYLDLLFGIEERSRYNFLHDYSAMRVGGVLELGGVEHTFSRTKQRNNSLLDAMGEPVSEMVMAAHLAGLSRDAYETMFSLNDETLEAGGKAILESRGDLGKLLFTATAGLGHVTDTLTALEKEADGLHRKQAHGTEIALLKKRLAELKIEKDKIDTMASVFEALESERRDAAEKLDRSISERSALSARRDTIARLLRLVPVLAEIRRNSARLAELPDIPSPPRSWTGSIAEMIDGEATLRTRRSGNAEEIDRLTARIAAVEVDETILAVSERVRALADRKVRYITAGLDLPNRRTELRVLDSAVANCLAELGRPSEPEPSSILLPAATVGAIRNMLDLRSGIVTSIRTARDEAQAALEALQAARDRVGQERAVPERARARLLAALSSARTSPHLSEARSAREAEDAGLTRWTAAIRRLHLSGDAGALARIPVPSPGQLAAWKARAAELGSSRALLAARLAELENEHELLSRRLEAMRSPGDVADDETAAAVRRARDEAWARHRDRLDGETADEFAVAMARDDTVAAVRLANARELAEIRSTIRRRAETAAALTRTRDQIAKLDMQLEELRSEIKAAAGDLLGELPKWSTERLIELVEDRTAALAEALAVTDEIEVARKKARRAADEADRIRRELTGALEGVGIMSDAKERLETITAAAELFIDRQVKVDAERAEAIRTVVAREEELAARRRAVDAAERHEQEWLAGIGEALKGTWLEGASAAPGLGNVLDRLADLSRTIQDRKALQIRIGKMEADRDSFVSEIAATAEEAGRAATGDDPEQLAVRLAERLELAERARDTRARLVDDLKKLQEACDSLEAEIAAHERQRNEVLNLFGVATLAEVMERDELLRERDRLRSTLLALRQELASELAVESFAEAEALLSEVDVDGLTVEKAEIEQHLQALDEAISGQLIRRTRAEDRIDAIGGDSTVARIDVERRTILLEIGEKAVRYLELKLGAMSAGHALRAYRESHRSEMMARASEAFAMITRGQYRGLAAQSIKGSEVLIALQRDGQSKIADALSKGARFQLYLALRLAGYYEFARHRPSVPFIADDIMETFDHVRSEEVFRLLGEMAEVGQVIYLTHHQHLCEIARAVVPEVTIHDLN